jgi:hypothetical protein
MAKLPDPPADLSHSRQALWRAILTDWPTITDHAHLEVLATGLRALDRAESARLLIDLEGATVRDRFDQTKVHPACSVERDGRNLFLSAIRLLGLDPREVP